MPPGARLLGQALPVEKDRPAHDAALGADARGHHVEEGALSAPGGTHDPWRGVGGWRDLELLTAAPPHLEGGEASEASPRSFWRSTR